MPKVYFEITDEKAIVPTKGTPFSVGYDLTAIKVSKKISDKTTLYDTGIKVQPEPGYYTEIIPRSSIIKTGYILSNSVGIIDSDYTGNLLIALTKVDDSLPNLEVPFCRCQLVLRKYEDYEMVNKTLRETERGDKGFGSTDAKPKLTDFEKVEKYAKENKIDLKWEFTQNKKTGYWTAKCYQDREMIASGRSNRKEEAQELACWHILCKFNVQPPYIK